MPKTKKIQLEMTREIALRNSLLTCKCGHPENNHFEFSSKRCAHCSCLQYKEQAKSGMEIV